jgi:membrane protease YdiL (CAAX protease family)
MNPHWAEENLHTIRTLMERSALYRRALAPVMLFAGIVGVTGGAAGFGFKLNSDASFALFWTGTALVAMLGALFLIRRQALRDSEPFWSPPARRVVQALLPAFIIGLMVGIFFTLLGKSSGGQHADIQFIAIVLWTGFYSCAVHAAGFFMPRGMRWFGWIYVCISGLLLFGVMFTDGQLMRVSPHLLMCCLFGGTHLFYGIYLYFTEKNTPVA